VGKGYAHPNKLGGEEVLSRKQTKKAAGSPADNGTTEEEQVLH
jgi:hypothetical protein